MGEISVLYGLPTGFNFIHALDIGGGGVENVIIFFPLWHTNYGMENNVYDE